VITIPTVFILGAGASAEYGFPLGNDLVRMIVAGTEGNGLLYSELLAAGFSGAEVTTFSRKLRDSDSLSIDTFLEGNGGGQFQAIGKAAIAITILRAEQMSIVGQKWLGQNVPADHWLRYVWNLMRSGCASSKDFTKNKVAVVTFNYDRSVEWYFRTVLESAFNLPGPSDAASLFESAVQVAHLHGKIAHREFGQYNTLSGQEVKQIASGIRVVHDAADEPQFKTAYKLFGEAQLLCLLGFGYHPVNIDRLRLNQSLPRHTAILASTYKMGEAEVRVAQGRIQRRFNTARGGLDIWSDYKAEKFLREVAELR